MKRQKFWVSWLQEERMNPTPGPQVLGWWERFDEFGDIVWYACVVGLGEHIGSQMRNATSVMEKHWPDCVNEHYNEDGWQCFKPMPDDFLPLSQEFPLDQVMADRFEEFAKAC